MCCRDQQRLVPCYHLVQSELEAIVFDFCAAYKSLERALGSPLQNYICAGGSVAFPTSEGINLASVLPNLFGVPWTGCCYGGGQWIGRASNTQVLEAVFPGVGVDKIDCCWKAYGLRGVAEIDHCVGHKYEQMFSRRSDDFDEDDYTEDADPAPKRGGQDFDVCVAEHAYGQGRFAALLNVNCELETAAMCVAFCLAPVQLPNKPQIRDRSPSSERHRIWHVRHPWTCSPCRSLVTVGTAIICSVSRTDFDGEDYSAIAALYRARKVNVKRVDFENGINPSTTEACVVNIQSKV